MATMFRVIYHGFDCRTVHTLEEAEHFYKQPFCGLVKLEQKPDGGQWVEVKRREAISLIKP